MEYVLLITHFVFSSDGIFFFLDYYQSMLNLLVIRDEEYNSDHKDKLKHIYKSSWKLGLFILESHKKKKKKRTLCSAIHEVCFAGRFESPSEGVQSKLWPHYVFLSIF